MTHRIIASSHHFCIPVILVLVVFAWLSSGYCAQRGISAAGGAVGARRVALVIGNADYDKGRLRNPVNDARAVSRALRELGFKVITGENLTYRAMRHKIIQFGDEVNKGGVGLFYFAGHGIQAQGQNYLIPIGARIQREAEVRAEGISLDSVLARMEGARNGLNIVILDACRNNPYARSFRSGGAEGLAQVAAPQGTFIAYATSPGSVAADGSGGNGVYTESLINHLATPGAPIERVFKQVRMEVAQRTGNKQVPWDESSLMGDFYFQPGAGGQAQRHPIQLADSPGPALGEVDKRKLKIQRLLKQADADLAANRLTTPPGNNALEKYQEVLRLNPMTSEANEGLKRIVGRYVDLAEGRIEARDWSAAEKYLGRAEQVREGDAQVLALRDKLREARHAGREESSTRPSSSRPASQPSQASPRGKRFTNSLGMEFVLVPAGSFDIGSNSGASDEKPVHRVNITKPFYLQTTEVTQGQWRSVMGNNPSHFKSCGDDCPVENVSWKDAQEFIGRLNQREGGKKYRLPTEAEWEYAARAGSTGAYCFGDDAGRLGDYGWYEKNTGRKTHRVGQKKPNAWGLYDMHGNVWEWCQDWYQKDYYSSSPGADPLCNNGASGLRVMRGGSWRFDAGGLRSAIRRRFNPGDRGDSLGLRLAKDY